MNTLLSTERAMHRTFYSIVSSFALLTILLSTQTISAQSVDTVGPRMVLNEVVRLETTTLVADFMKISTDPRGLDSATVDAMAVDWLATYLLEHQGEPFFPIPHRYEVGEVWSIRPEGNILMVQMTTYPDSVPYHGIVEVDWSWFVRRNDEGEWRLSAVRRTQGILQGIEAMKMIHGEPAYPASIKPVVAREEEGILLSNRDLRREFAEHLGALNELVARLEESDQIRVLERQGDRPRQLNTKLVDWGMAANELSEEVIAEFIALAPPEAQSELESRLRAAEKQKEKATLAMQAHAREFGLRPSVVDEIVILMKQARIRFINTETPFKDGVLMTIDGELEQAVGFLYSPHGELPWINPEEFFYLEELGDGWWIYRSA